MRLTEAQIEAGRSPKGGWTRAQLATWGVPWPPPKGWRAALTQGRNPQIAQPEPYSLPPAKTHFRMKTKAADFPNLPMARFYFATPYKQRCP